jgi:hypothetical protein
MVVSAGMAAAADDRRPARFNQPLDVGGETGKALGQNQQKVVRTAAAAP